MIWSSDLPSKNEEEEGKTIWWRWRNLADEETQEDEETQNEDEETMKTKKVKLESLKLEFHVENMWIFFHISSHHLQIET